MTIRWYRFAVFALWLAAMSWLTVRKILPPFFTGEPPVYESAGSDKPRPPVAWYIYLNERRLGWALSEISQQSTDTTEIHSLVHFDSLPLDELLPIYLRALARASTQAAGSMEMEVESDLITNPLNQLVSFYSKFRPKGGQSLVKIEGSVEGDKLKIGVRVGDYEIRISNCRCPRTRFATASRPKWNCGACTWASRGRSSPTARWPCRAIPWTCFEGRPPTEVLFAKVEEQTRLTWNGRLEPMWVVVYRSDTQRRPRQRKEHPQSAVGPPRRHGRAAGSPLGRPQPAVHADAREGCGQVARRT